ncbi:hypothetical protein GCM10027515_04310 [Schumannella luteola]|uniref:Uncharacterized protein n=1 Tax=Schumannella luteola TaxID=472059 RepID=A0A852Y7U1_9MICO|nr:hypothetical protein [Schumannella luteola]NYG98433.1 hypothetical protein [Schumannella luteola]TPX01334.1 hypothetical protein FJ656_28525 [Schumannella luteola]
MRDDTAGELPVLREEELDQAATLTDLPPIVDATAAIGAHALVVTWNLASPLSTTGSQRTHLNIWFPRNGGGPLQLGLEVTPPTAIAFAVDFEHRVIRRRRSVRVRVGERRIVALFPLDWVHDLEPVEISHTSALLESPGVFDPALRLRFDIVSE